MIIIIIVVTPNFFEVPQLTLPRVDSIFISPDVREDSRRQIHFWIAR